MWLIFEQRKNSVGQLKVVIELFFFENYVQLVDFDNSCMLLVYVFWDR